MENGPPARKWKIFILDDHPAIRDCLRFCLEREEFTISGEADNASAALNRIQRAMPDLVIVDISLKSGRNGLEFVKDLKNIYPSLPILVFSMHDEALFAERVLRAGANGYVSKEEPLEVIIGAIRKVLAGEVHVSNRMSEMMVKHFLRGAAPSSLPSVERLTDRELEIFQLVGRGRTTAQIADELNLALKTVETYRGRIKSKLGLSNATELHQYALQWTTGEIRVRPRAA